MKNIKIISFVNLLLFAFMIIMNVLAITLPLNNKTTVELSDKYSNLFVPSGSTFSIWGIIYLLLLAHLLFAVIVSFKKETSKILTPTFQILFGFTCLLNGSWIVAWHYEIMPLSVIIMVALLITLCKLFILITEASPLTLLEKICIHIPITVYTGWISVAMIANATAYLVSLGMDPFNMQAEILLITTILIAIVLALIMQFKHNNTAHGLVLIWALIGIYKNPYADNLKNTNFFYIILAISAALFLYDIIKKMMRRTSAVKV